MRYRLSLDLGVSSIGSAVIELNNENEACNIIDSSTRIFSVSEGSEDRRSKRTARKNNERTKMRLNLLSSLLYENGLWEHASPQTPRNKQKSPPYILCPYAIRANSINGKLNSPYEIGRAILHLAKHRGAGFVDAIEEIKEEEEKQSRKKKESSKSSYEKLVDNINNSGARTIGEYFHMRLKKGYKNNNLETGRVVRQRTTSLVKEKPVDYAIPRYLVKDEFKQIWEQQSKYYPQLKKEGLQKEVYDILFYERNPAPYATADCIYIDGEKRLLKAHPLSEKRRIYESVNNIRLLGDGTKRKLTIQERDKIINEILYKGNNANKTSVRKVLSFDKKTDILFSDNESGIKPYIYSKKEFQEIAAIANSTEEQLTKLAEFLAEPKINPEDENSRLLREEDFFDELKKIFDISDEKQIGSLIAKLPKGRGSIGLTATKQILSKLQESVISQREATDRLVLEGNESFKAEEVLAQEIQGKYDTLPYYGEILKKDTQPIHPWHKKRIKSLNEDEKAFGKIANPAVHMMLNQLRHVVNDAVRIYGKPYEINIELGRDVGMSTKKKNEFETIKKKNEKQNEEAVQYLLDNKIRINRENILKYKLAKEQNWKDAFNPQLRIDPRFSGFEIEHLVPQSKGGTDTYNNLTLVAARENSLKSEQFPYEYFSNHKSDEEVTNILKAIRSNSNIPDGKKWRFEPDAKEKYDNFGDEDESNRYLTDTRYMAKLAARYLRAILDFSKANDNTVTNTRILTVNGANTAKLRTAWNLDGLEYELMSLDIPRYIDCPPYWKDEETGEVIDGIQKPDIDGKWIFKDKKRNPDWKRKPRIDHRHHALDAITLGCVNRNFIQKMNWSEKRGHILRADAYPMPLADMKKENAKEERAKFRNDVLSILQNTHISHKADHSKAGQLHEETGKTILKLDDKFKDKIVTKYTRSIMAVLKKFSDLSKLSVSPSVKSEWHSDIAKDREKMEKLISDFKEHLDIAEQNLIEKNDELKEDGKKEKTVSENMVLSEAFKMIKNKGLYKGDKFPTYTNEKSLIIIEKHNLAYKSGNNHRVDFYEKDGKVSWQVINNFNANDKYFIPDSKNEGAKPIWSVHQGDLIELDTPEKWQHFSDRKRCIAQVRKFSSGKMAIAYYSDARMTSPPKDSPEFMNIEMFSDNGLSFYSTRCARKIELTPFGKVKKKHKKLWHGKKA